jgi:hypothetical protein
MVIKGSAGAGRGPYFFLFLVHELFPWQSETLLVREIDV